MILSIIGLSPGALGLIKSIGITLIKIENLCLVAPITLSMWIRTLAKHLVSSTSLGESCVHPRVNDGICNDACILATSSAISKSLSANTTSPCRQQFI